MVFKGMPQLCSYKLIIIPEPSLMKKNTQLVSENRSIESLKVGNSVF